MTLNKQGMRLFNNAMTSMKRRYKYSYNVFDYIYNLAWPLPLFPWRKHSLLSLYNRYKLLKKGEDMYIKEFDAVYFARSIRNLKMLVATLMDDSERFLSTYQQFNAISLVSESNSSNSSDDPYEKIPKLLASRNKRYKHEKWVDNFFVSIIISYQNRKNIYRRDLVQKIIDLWTESEQPKNLQVWNLTSFYRRPTCWIRNLESWFSY